MWAFYVLGLGKDLPVSVTKYDLAGIILHLCKKLDWIEEPEIDQVEKHNTPDRQKVQKKTTDRVEETKTCDNRIVREQKIIEVEGNYINPKIEVLKRELEDVMDQPRLETNSLANMNENCNFESEAAISQQKVTAEGAQNEDIEVMDMKLETENLDMPKYGGPGTKRQVCDKPKCPIDWYEEGSVPANKDTRRTSKGADVDGDWMVKIAPKKASSNNTSHQSSWPEFPTATLVDRNLDLTDLCKDLQGKTSRPTKRSSDKISWIRSIRSVAVRVTPPPLTANLTPKTLVDQKKPNFRHKTQDLYEAMNNPHVKPRLSYGYMIAMALLVNNRKH